MSTDWEAEVYRLRAKLAAAVAERDGAIADRDEAEKNRNKFERDLQDAEALLARRPHLKMDWDSDDDMGAVTIHETSVRHNLKECARLGGACAKVEKEPRK